MAQMRGPGSYGLGAGPGPAQFGGPSEDRSESSPLDAIRQQTSKIEDLMDTVSEPLKPYALPPLLFKNLAIENKRMDIC
jgi:hypothetical protein